MKAAPFDYLRPDAPDDVVAELEQAGGSAKVLAGGQSLLPVLAMRLGRPTALIDITRVRDWDRWDERDGWLRIGAAVRQRTAERQLADRLPLLGYALPFVGHREIRSRGTICGSLAHADPAAELPAVAVTLAARLRIRGPQGERTVAAADFFTGAMTTALGPGEVLGAVEFPLPTPGEGYALAEVARRHGDFALVGVVARVRMRDGAVESARLTCFGVADRPQVRDVTELMSAGPPTADDLAALADEVTTTAGDRHADVAYRRRLVRVLGARELGRAARRAGAAR